MFARRHPFLFFSLVFTTIMAVTVLGASLLIYLGARHSDYGVILTDGEDKVGVIEISGVIAEAKDTLYWLKQFREEESIKAIVIRIDSPGGVVGPSQEIYREVRKTNKVKKVIASMGAIAASGGYYIAAGADGIVANPGTITGSIGVIVGYTNFKALLDKIGLVPVVIKSGEYKDIGSPSREMTASEREVLQAFVDQTHQQFIDAIADGRNMDAAKVAELADGRIYTGQEAKSLGLIDRLGNLEDAIEWAGRQGGIKGKVEAVYPPPEKLSWFRHLMTSSLNSLIDRLTTRELTGGFIYTP
jgi:protease-4